MVIWFFVIVFMAVVIIGIFKVKLFVNLVVKLVLLGNIWFLVGISNILLKVKFFFKNLVF